MVRGFLNSYFGFNRQQRNGLLVLMSVSLFLLIVRLTYPYFMDESEIEVKYIPLAATDSTAQQDTVPKKTFDPNTAGYEELIQLGFTPKTASTLIKYRKHNRFRQKEDLLKVYGVTEKLFVRLRPYIVITTENAVAHKAAEKKQTIETKQQPAVELNSADSVQLLAVPGIGPVYAGRILKYRRMLGGFTEIAQLREVYGLNAENYARISGHVFVDKQRAGKINLNTDDFKTVNRHPYISYELTKTIFNARRVSPLDSAKFRQLIANDSLYRKVLPYLSF